MLRTLVATLILLAAPSVLADDEQAISADTPQALRASLQRLGETMTHSEYVRFTRAAVALTTLNQPGVVPRPDRLLMMFGMDFGLLIMPLLMIDLLPDDQGFAQIHARLAPVLDRRTPTEVRRSAREAVAELQPMIEAKLLEMERRQGEQSSSGRSSAGERSILERSRETLRWLETAF